MSDTVTPAPTSENNSESEHQRQRETNTDIARDSHDNSKDHPACKPRAKRRRQRVQKNRRGEGDDASAPRLGNTSAFSGPQMDWIARTYPEYQTYLGERKAHCPIRCKLKTPRADWVESTWKNFVKEFGASNIFSCMLDGKIQEEADWKAVRYRSTCSLHILNGLPVF